MEIFAVSGLINGIVSVAFGVLVFLKNWRDRTNQLFLLMTGSLAVWSFGYWRWLSTTDPSRALMWVQILSIGSLFIPIFFFHWATLLMGKNPISKYVLWVVYPVSIAIAFAARTPFFIQSLSQKAVFPLWPTAGPLYDFYFSYIYVGLITFTFYLLLRVFFDAKTPREKKGQMLYIFLGGFLGFGGGLSNFPLWWNINILPYGNFLVAAFPFLLGYSIIKYQLFNVKAIATELLVFFMGMILFVQATLATSFTDLILRGGFAVAVSILGYFVIRSVYREVAQREHIEKLAKDLESANARLKELDTAKSEFLSLATHQLRAPITAIKGYASMIAEGDFGPASPELKQAVDVIVQSGNSMAVMVDDFLNISRIEQGRMKYDLVIADAAVLTQEVVNELRPAIEKKGLQFTFDYDKTQKYDVRIDVGKIKQAITNLIDNAMKYTPKGWIHVTTERIPATDENFARIQIKISDNGVGISAENIPKLFSKFSRAANGISTNVSGTGLGLYVVKQMVEAHNGRVWVTSDGEGKGSQFYIELKTLETPTK